MKKMLPIALLLSFCLAIAAAEPARPPSGLPAMPDITGMITEGQSSWQGILILVVLLGFFINTLLYMFAIAFNFQSMKMWCKSEYMQLIVTLILIIALIAFVHTIWASAGAITELTVQRVVGIAPVSASPFEVTKTYLNNLAQCEREYYAYIFRVNFIVEKAANFGQDVTGAEPLGAWYLTGFVGLMHYITGLIVYGLLLQYVQLRVLDYIYITMLQLYLPLGLVLRAFPLTRGAGAFLIAAALGFFFVFPLTYMIIISLPGATYSSCGDSLGMEIQRQNEQYREYGNRICPDYTIADSEIAVYETKEGFASGPLGWLDLADRIRDRMVFIVLQSFFYPIIALTIAFTFIRQTSTLFGADIAELGRGLIRLI